MGKIKILMLGLSRNIGGVETYIKNVVEHVDLKRFEFYFPKQDGQLAYEELIIKNHHIFATPVPHRRIIAYKKMWTSIFKNYEFDVIYFNACDIVSIDILKIAKNARVPVRIIHSHSSGNQQGIQHKLSLFHQLSEKNSRKTLHQYATHMLACSEAAGDWMFDGRPYEVVKNGVSISQYAFDAAKREECREQLGIEHGSVVGVIGRLSPQKKPLYTVQIAKAIHTMSSDAKIVMIGDGELRSEVEQAISDEGLENTVLLTGAVDNVNEWLSAVDVILMPSLFEGLPFVLVEAQAAGVPCVVSNTVSKEADLTGLVRFVSLDESTETWARTVLDAAITPEKRKDTTQQLIDAGYSIEATANRVSEIIEKALTK